MMKILFIGLGSIGQRHLLNLVDILDARNISYEMHALRSKPDALPKNVSVHICRQFFDFEEIDSFYDIIFITNPTSMHYATLAKVSGRAKRFFIEKPIFNRDEKKDVVLRLNKDSIYYVAAPLRYTRVVQFLKEYIKNRDVYAVRSICSSYLPEWRPSVDYRQVYSARKSAGGGVDLDLIHEWDYLVYLFGLPQKVSCMSGKYSKLEIDSQDLALYIGEYEDKLISVHLDYFGREPIRQVELYMQDDIVVGDFYKSEIRFLKAKRTEKLPEDRNAYQKAELKYFLQLTQDIDNMNTIQHACDVLKIAEGKW